MKHNRQPLVIPFHKISFSRVSNLNAVITFKTVAFKQMKRDNMLRYIELSTSISSTTAQGRK